MTLNTFERYFLSANRWTLIALLAAMSVIIFVNVALRYLTNQSLEWAEEVARHMMIWLTFLGAGPVLRYGGHIAVENLQDAMPRALAVATRAFVAALLFAFFGLLLFLVGAHDLFIGEGVGFSAADMHQRHGEEG